MSILSRLLGSRKAPEQKVRGDVKPKLWIGLDYGTATTECVVRIEHKHSQDEVFVLATHVGQSEHERVIIPSVIHVTPSHVAGPTAIDRSAEFTEHLKYKLLKEAESNSLDWTLDGAAGRSVFLLADVIRIARGAAEKYINLGGLPTHLNTAAPTNGDPKDPATTAVISAFHDVAFRAFTLADRIPKGVIDRAQAESLLQWALSQSIPEQEDSPVTVISEALAAVCSFLMSDGRSKGDYATIDVGGGTTDLSFFWFQAPSPAQDIEKKSWYYAVHTVPVGMADLLVSLPERRQDRHHRTSHEQLAESLANFKDGMASDAMHAMCQDLSQAYSEVWKQAFKKHQSLAYWVKNRTSTWELLLLGGGSAFEFISHSLKKELPYDSIDKHKSVSKLKSPLRLVLLLGNGTKSGQHALCEDYRQNRHMFNVAFGLSFRTPDIPPHGSAGTWAPRQPKFTEPPGHVSFDV